MRAVVTGGAGFIGSNLVDALVERGDEVFVLDDLSSGKRENLASALARGASLEIMDVRDGEAVSAFLERIRPKVVVHLAAQIDVRVSVESPAFDARTNIEGTVNVLEAARRHGARRVVFSSTGGAIYGETDQVPTPETHDARPMAGYGTSKLCAEQYLDLYSRLYGLSTVALRFGNVYGPRQDSMGEAGVIAIFCRRFLTGGRPTVFGDGTQTRDYIFVRDLVQAIIAAADADVTGALNIGTEVETTVLELVDAVRAAQAESNTFVPDFMPARIGEVHRSCLSVARAQETLRWKPRVDVHNGVALTLAALALADG